MIEARGARVDRLHEDLAELLTGPISVDLNRAEAQRLARDLNAAAGYTPVVGLGRTA